jgi:hypothetical protein
MQAKPKAAAKAAKPAAAHPLVPTVATPAPATPAAPAPVVALRGGPAVQAVTLGAKAYRVTAPHNVAWWQAITATLQANGGIATVQQVTAAAGCPLTLLGYLLRRGHLAAATVPAAQ